MSLNYKTPDYFRDFQCLGSDCPDTCCQHWEVKLDRSHYHLWQEKIAQNESEKKLFEDCIYINEQPVTGDHDYAFIRMTNEGSCPMLSNNKLCSLHDRYGIEPLGDVCAFYPRVISRCGADMELSGALSCPQVARLCLLSKQPFKLARFNVSQLPRSKDYPIQRELPQNPFDYYAGNFRLVRQKLVELAANEDFSLNVRLYALAELAQRISVYYHRDCKTIESTRLERDFQQVVDRGNLNNIENYLAQDDSVNLVAMLVVRAILEIKITQFPDEKLSQIAKKTFTASGPGSESSISDIPIEDIQNTYNKVRQAISPAMNEKIDRYFTRYLCNCLFREWYFTMPDTFTYMQMLFIRMAMLRFLFYSEPRLQLLLKEYEQADRQGQSHLQAELDSLAINLVYNFARAVDQNLSFLQLVYTAVSEQDMFNFDYSLAFVKF
ncbi:hypothetical protein MNBD_GAMMA24-2435 [hydrothermal vent metagenome]|uniref:Lysine-N-methylase n=1 Tax=hydrothermal vent metagenome TaxID=652676 RepID=A0A3B1BMV6_9ZZZZ